MEQWEAILKSIADDTRRRLVCLLLDQDYCVGALAKIVGITEAAVSQHLKVLREIGLVTGEKRGYYTHYRVNRKLLKTTARHITELASIQPSDKSICSVKAENCLCHKENGK